MAREGVRVMRRRLLSLAALAALLLPGTGCMINQYSSDPLVRMEQMMIDSENLRQMHDEWRRFWMNDQPSHLTPYRIHGGVGPASSHVGEVIIAGNTVSKQVAIRGIANLDGAFGTSMRTFEGRSGAPRVQFAPVFMSPNMEWAVPN